MRPTAPNRLWFVGALLALSGCGHAIDTHVDGDLVTPTFHFTQGGDRQPCIREFSVTNVAGSAHETMWDAHSDTGSCQKLAALRYGVPPNGYSQWVPTRPLSPNGRYSLFVEGLGADAPGGWCDFAWDGHRWTTHGSFCSPADGR